MPFSKLEIVKRISNPDPGDEFTLICTNNITGIGIYSTLVVDKIDKALDYAKFLVSKPKKDPN